MTMSLNEPAWRIADRSERGYLLRDEYDREAAEVYDAETALRVCRAMNDAVRETLTAEIERLRTALEEVRRYTLAVVGGAEAYGETESAHLWQEVADIADAALYPPVESPT